MDSKLRNRLFGSKVVYHYITRDITIKKTINEIYRFESLCYNCGLVTSETTSEQVQIELIEFINLILIIKDWNQKVRTSSIKDIVSRTAIRCHFCFVHQSKNYF